MEFKSSKSKLIITKILYNFEEQATAILDLSIFIAAFISLANQKILMSKSCCYTMISSERFFSWKVTDLKFWTV
jgi:hypothetical protein